MDMHVFVAGTFDHLHKGHEALLKSAFREGEKVTIGLTSDVFVAKFKIPPFAKVSGGRQNSPLIQPFERRKEGLLHWVAENGYQNKTTLIPIDDPYEPAASMADLDALMVTAENRNRGEEINVRRLRKGLKPLLLLEALTVHAEDKKPISSTRLRKGEIDRAGRLVMPENMRPELKKLLGKLLTAARDIESALEVARKAPLVVTVGDMATKTLLAADFVPDVAIVDGKIMRTPVADFSDVLGQFSHVVSVTSGPGYIARAAVEVIRKSIAGPKNESIAINVTGEEDLLVLPVISAAPIGALVYYGQPGEGLVEVIVSARKKEEAIALLSRFQVD